MKKLIFLLLGLTPLTITAQSTIYWSGNSGSSDNIDQGANWHGGSNPNSGDNLYFNNTGTRHKAYSNYVGGSYFNNFITYNGAGGIEFYGDNSYFNKIENSNDPNLLKFSNSTIGGRGSDFEINPVGSGGIYIASSTLNIDGGKQLKVYGTNELKIDAAITQSNGTATLAIYGAADVILNGACTYTGLTTISAGTLQLNKTGGGTLNSTNDVTVSGGTLKVSTNQTLDDLTMTSGSLTVDDGVTLTINGDFTIKGEVSLGSGIILIGSSGTIIGASSSNFIRTTGNGSLRKEFSSPGSFVFPIGTTGEYTPVTLDFTSLGSSSYAGVRSVASAHGSFIGGTPSHYLERNWVLTEGGFSSFACDISCVYVDADIVGTESSIYCGKWSGSSWLLGNATNTTDNELSFDGATSFSDIAGAPPASLPVALLDFSANLLDNNQTEITWSTASELNASHFNIHRSLDGIEKTRIGEVAASGTSNEIEKYSFMDYEPITQRTLYFLEQVDFDGQVEWFGPQVVDLESTYADKVYFNAAKTDLTIHLNSNSEAEKIKVTMLNSLGQIVLSKELPISGKSVSLLLPKLATGVYTVITETGDAVSSTKLYY